MNGNEREEDLQVIHQLWAERADPPGTPARHNEAQQVLAEAGRRIRALPAPTPPSGGERPFWVQGQTAAGWETLAEFATKGEAELALADAGRFPLDRMLRVVEARRVL